MSGVLVLGLGSRLFMDDGIGVAVVEALAGRWPPDCGLTCVAGETDVAFCLQQAMAAGRLILVDAAATGRPPGSVSLIPLGDLEAGGPGLTAHQAHLIDLLPPDRRAEGLLIAVEPAEIGFQCGLSPTLAARFDAIVQQVQGAIDRLMSL